MAFRGASSATYTFASGNGATVDLGATNNYRYINATNVYNQGKSDGNNIFPLSYCYINCVTTNSSYTVKIMESNGTIKSQSGLSAMGGNNNPLVTYIKNNWSELSNCVYASSDATYWYFNATIKNSGKWFCSTVHHIYKWTVNGDTSVGKVFEMRAGIAGNTDLYMIFNAVS